MNENSYVAIPSNKYEKAELLIGLVEEVTSALSIVTDSPVDFGKENVLESFTTLCRIVGRYLDIAAKDICYGPSCSFVDVEP